MSMSNVSKFTDNWCLDRESVKHIVLDCPASVAKQIIVKHVQTIVLGIVQIVKHVQTIVLGIVQIVKHVQTTVLGIIKIVKHVRPIRYSKDSLINGTQNTGCTTV